MTAARRVWPPSADPRRKVEGPARRSSAGGVPEPVGGSPAPSARPAPSPRARRASRPSAPGLACGRERPAGACARPLPEAPASLSRCLRPGPSPLSCRRRRARGRPRRDRAVASPAAPRAISTPSARATGSRRRRSPRRARGGMRPCQSSSARTWHLLPGDRPRPPARAIGSPAVRPIPRSGEPTAKRERA